jgi:hypothetical protein
MEIGTSTTRQITVRYCKACNAVIGDTGMCSYECPEDCQVKRKPGTVIARTYTRVDTLIAEKEI